LASPTPIRVIIVSTFGMVSFLLAIIGLIYI